MLTEAVPPTKAEPLFYFELQKEGVYDQAIVTPLARRVFFLGRLTSSALGKVDCKALGQSLFLEPWLPKKAGA